MHKGCVISIEGIDGCGKGTNSRLMVKYLESQGKKVKKYDFPQYETEIGKVIARYLKGEFGSIDTVPRELICIAYAANRAEFNEEIRQLLEEGYYVVFDRYTYSNLFSAAKMPDDTWKPFIDWIEKMEFENLKNIEPDYNFYLYIEPEKSIEQIEHRGKRDYQEGKEDIHENNPKLLTDTARCYLEFAKTHNNWFIINQMEDRKQISVDRVFDKIKEKLDEIIATN